MSDPSHRSPPRQVAAGLLLVPLPLPAKPTIVQSWLLDCGGGEWALVDTGVALPASRQALLAALGARGIEPRQVRHLIGTHHHPDHFGASRPLAEQFGARLYLHPAELERIEYALAAGPEDMVHHSRRHGMPVRPEAEREAPRPREVWAGSFDPATRIDHLLEDGEVLSLARRRLRVVATPGHTPGHCCLLDLETGALLVGDHLLPKITPHVGVFATGPTNPLGDYLASLEKVAALDAALVCPAHGPVYRDHRRRARQIAAHHEYRLRVMADALKGGPATAYSVSTRAFRWVFENPENRFQVGAALMETVAHLELLCARGVARREDRDGIVYYAIERSVE